MKESTQPVYSHKKNIFVRGTAIVFFSFVAGFLGAWIFIQTGLVQLDNLSMNSTTREKIVSQEGEVMAEVAQKTSPSVVSVTTQSIVQSRFGRESVAEGAGTGMIISKDGYVLTNKHVAGSSAANLSVVTNDGKVYKDVAFVGSDPFNDVAFLKINSKDTFTPVTFANSGDVKVGQKVLAIGNALGEFQNSVTAGIISGVGRPIVAGSGQDAENLDNLLQTDAAINHGNSGGPLLNFSGEVVGMNTAVAEDAQGIGFAIPSNAVKGLIKNLLATGKVQRAYLGVQYISLTPTIAEQYNLSVKQGAYISTSGMGSAVVSGSPADKAGLKDKDIITKVNGVHVTTANGLAVLLAQFAPGDKVTLTVITGDATRDIQVTLSEYTEPN